ncbi:hypothetical protein A0O30_19560 [Pseudomonas sp. LLC-1]|uniref:hypothetical protein n=1 Tax=Pseudomonas sp. LLC-1 TaxID=1812180 RepID=UPI000D0210B9|nr:hypothetical protein [Pseudomonas sp. LLC-1]PRN02975.1 hypothetical protein A0O30_19560 [Pseudomonas sp. LLC-1]
MNQENEKIRELLKDKPADFDSHKDWANFNLAARSATKKRSPLEQISACATTVSAIIGIAAVSVTTYQLWNKIDQEKQESRQHAQFEALKLYTESWDKFNDKRNCRKFEIFAEGIRESYNELAISASQEFARVCRTEIGSSEQTASVTGDKPLRDTSYSSLEKTTPSSQIQAANAEGFYGLTVYIQYSSDNPSSKDNAEKIRSFIASDEIGASAPGKEGVSNVPKYDQIRIYKDAQKTLASRLAKELNDKFSMNFKIISLEMAYPNLPANRLEIWLKDN